MANKLRKECEPDCPKDSRSLFDLVEANHLMRSGFPDSALQFVHHWLPQLDLQDADEKSRYISFTNMEGQCYRRLGRLEEATETFSSVMRIRGELDSTLLLKVMINLSTVDMELQKLHRARQQLIEAMRIATALEGPQSIKLAYCLNNLGSIENALGEPGKAAEYLRQAIAIKEVMLGGSHPSLATSYLNLGGLYGEVDQFEKALAYTHKAYVMDMAITGKYHSHTVLACVTLGSLNAELGRRDSAYRYLKAAEEAYSEVVFANPYMASLVLQYIGKGYLLLEENDKARRFLDRAMEGFGVDPLGEIDFAAFPGLWYLHHNLRGRAEIYREALAAGEEVYADSLELILEKHLALYNHLQGRKRALGDRRVATQLAFPLFEDYLHHLSGMQEPPLEKVLELMELGKARLLSEKLQQANIREYAGVPDAVVAREAELDSLVSGLQNKIAGLRARRKLAGILALEEELNGQRLEQDEFVEGLQRDYPAYHGIKYVQEPVSLREAQASLAEGEALVSYLVGNHDVYVLVLHKGAGKLRRIPLDFPLRTWVSEFRTAMYSHQKMAARSEAVAEEHAKAYCQAAYALYDKLVRPIEADLPMRVCVIPDGVLAFVPFDALLSQMPENPVDFRSHPYLIHQYQFSYSISATLRQQQLQADSARAEALQSALVMAPAFSGGGHLRALQHNAEEAEKIQSLFGGKVLTGKAATSEAFRRLANDFRILHLASHAKSDDQNGDSSYIAFAAADTASSEADLLYARDLYGIPMQASLVVLSACETALGEWQVGEGIVGLARACIYAGAKSTMTSLWQVDDGQTADLVAQFYTGLRDGLSKDAALRQAKLNYLKTQAPPHPYYWAAFIPIGNMSPLHFEAESGVMWLGLSVLLLLLIGVVIVRKMKKS